MRRTTGQWAAVGWQHLYLETPEDWSIGSVNGDAVTGYLRLDDVEMPRVEVRWEQAKGDEPVDRVVDRYLDTLVKKTRRNAPPVKVRRNLSLLKGEQNHEERTAEGFHWKTEGEDAIQAYGLLWRCQVCSRIVFIQVLARVGESILPIASQVLNSLQDHPIGDTAVWAAYGMRVEVPESYVLKEQKFMTGQIVLGFSGNDEELEIKRMSLADMQLQDETFEEWFLKGEGDVEQQDALPDDVFRHPGIVATGTTVDPETVKKRLSWLPWRRPRIRQFDRCGWHCPDGNKLYTLRRLAGTANREQLLQIARTLVCH